jgi:methionine synthase II (cobalamin-independent)
MTLPTEPIGSIPRPATLISGMQAFRAGQISEDELESLFDTAVRDTIERFEETGSPVITDGEQRKPSFATYPVHGGRNLGFGGVTIPFKDGHTRQLPVLTAGPFRDATYAASYLAIEQERGRVLKLIGAHATDGRHIFVGVTNPISARIETADEVRDLVLEAARFIDPARLGTTDDCGFSPFGDDTSTSRETAFAKIRARVQGTAMASRTLGV